MSPTFTRGASIALVCLLIGCSHYAWVGRGEWAAGTRLALMPPEEATPLGVTDDFTRRAANILGSAGVFLASRAQHSDFVWSGRISVSFAPQLGQGGIKLVQLEGLVAGTLRASDGRVVWEGESKGTDSYYVTDVASGAEPLVTETNRRVALKRLAEQLGESLGEQLLLANLSQPDKEVR